MTEYMVVIVGDAERWWSTMSLQERKDGYGEYTRFSEELSRRGHRITGGAELHSTAEARTGDAVEIRRTLQPEERTDAMAAS